MSSVVASTYILSPAQQRKEINFKILSLRAPRSMQAATASWRLRWYQRDSNGWCLFLFGCHTTYCFGAETLGRCWLTWRTHAFAFGNRPPPHPRQHGRVEEEIKIYFLWIKLIHRLIEKQFRISLTSGSLAGWRAVFPFEIAVCEEAQK